jgi:hypothetical protein
VALQQTVLFAAAPVGALSFGVASAFAVAMGKPAEAVAELTDLTQTFVVPDGSSSDGTATYTSVLPAVDLLASATPQGRSELVEVTGATAAADRALPYPEAPAIWMYR